MRDTVEKNKSDPTIFIYWDQENKCKLSDRNTQDNVSNLFFPKILEIKQAFEVLQKSSPEKEDFDSQVNWIQASLCDGEDEKSAELVSEMDDTKITTAPSHKIAIQIEAKVYDVVIALHRVEAFKLKLKEIFSKAILGEATMSDPVS